MSDNNNGFEQNDILRIYDFLTIGIVAFIIFIMATIFLGNGNLFFLFGSVIEGIGLILGFKFVRKERKRLEQLGKWKKLTLKESLDLHEWRVTE